MPIDLGENAAVLTGIREVAEAETLLAWLQAYPQGPVHVSRCEHAHTAVVQVLMAVRPTLTGQTAGDDGPAAWLGALRPQGNAA